jgi:hypothetical protein
MDATTLGRESQGPGHRVGPCEFAGLLNAARAEGVQSQPSYVYAATIGPERLADLVELVYYASLIPEEGQFPRFRLLVPSQHDRGPEHLAIRFEPAPVLSDPKQLAALAPTLEFAYSALSVEQAGAALRVAGVVQPGTQDSIDQLEPSGARLTGLELRVHGPGWLAVRGEGIRMALRAGQASSLDTIRSSRCVSDWLESVAASASPPPAPHGAPIQLPTPGRVVLEVWLTLLGSVLEYRRGGTFVVLDRPAESGLLAMKHTVTADSLPSLLREFLVSRQRAASRDAPPRDRSLADLSQQLVLRRVRSFTRMLGRLSTVDGCVVLDRGMNLVGFGAKIKADEAASRSPLTFRASREYPNEEALSHRHGTRHHSALQLVKARPNSLAFVVSQDGDLRVFTSDDQFYACEMGYALD